MGRRFPPLDIKAQCDVLRFSSPPGPDDAVGEVISRAFEVHSADKTDVVADARSHGPYKFLLRFRSFVRDTNVWAPVTRDPRLPPNSRKQASSAPYRTEEARD